MKQKLTHTLLFLAIVAILVSCGLETYLRLRYNQLSDVIYNPRNFPELVQEKWETWYLEVNQDRIFGKNSTLQVVGRPDPFLGWDSVTNGHRYRGAQYYSEAKDRDTFRIVTIGDSFTYGTDVAAKKTFSHFLEQKETQIEVINMGVPGYGVDQAILKYLRYGKAYAPDLVILGFFEAGFARATTPFFFAQKPVFRANPSTGKVKLTGIPVPSPEEVYKRLSNAGPQRLTYSALFLKNFFLDQIYRKYLNRDYLDEYYDEWIRVHEHIYSLLIAELARSDAELLALFIPAANIFIDGRIFIEEQGGVSHDRMIGLFEKLNIDYVDLVEEFPKTTSFPTIYEEFYFQGGRYERDGGHLTKKGNQQVADLLYAKIKRLRPLGQREHPFDGT
jgi:lysophospholipase L1-like esterase